MVIKSLFSRSDIYFQLYTYSHKYLKADLLFINGSNMLWLSRSCSVNSRKDVQRMVLSNAVKHDEVRWRAGAEEPTNQIELSVGRLMVLIKAQLQWLICCYLFPQPTTLWITRQGIWWHLPQFSLLYLMAAPASWPVPICQVGEGNLCACACVTWLPVYEHTVNLSIYQVTWRIPATPSPAAPSRPSSSPSSSTTCSACWWPAPATGQ